MGGLRKEPLFPAPTGFKCCTKGKDCAHPDGPVQPATREYFYKGKNRADGLHHWCIACMKAYNKARLANDEIRERIYAYNREFKKEYDKRPEVREKQREYRQSESYKERTSKYWQERCRTEEYRAYRREYTSTPKQVESRKRRIAEYKRTGRYAEMRAKYEKSDARKEQRKLYRIVNRETINANRREWRKANLELALELERARRQTEAYKASQRKAEQKRKNRQEYIRAYSREWKRNNRDKVRAKEHKRLARIRELPSNFSPADWNAALEYWHGVCAYCGKQRDFWFYIEQEHFVPVALGGGYTVDNIIPACKYCNSSKCDSDPHEWVIKKFGKRKGKEILARIEAYFEWARQREDKAS